jgi:polyferredoxin/NAD-dependent dihydropyrimidine dehydrogenase PreA subunit
MKLRFGWKQWRGVRQVVQILFFALFIILLFAGLQRQTVFSLADIFFRINPLSALTTMLASRAWIPRLGWALVTMGLTILIGRVWCGWICPFGTLLEWVTFRKARQRARSIPPQWRTVKYVLLVVILVGAVFGNLTLLILDPLALFTRAMTTVVVPGLNYFINASESSLYSLAFMRPAISWLETVIRGPVLPVVQPVFNASLLVAGLFFGILALNLLADRFWCRYLCPLGGLLGFLSKFSILRPLIGQACTGCTRCALLCKPGAIKTIPASAESSHEVEIMPAECTVCLDCLANCAKDGLGIGLVLKPAPAQEFDLTRRQFLQSLAVGAAAIVVLRTNMRLRTRNSRLIRPPGANDEEAFLSKCLRCSECMKVCPTNGLQPVQGEAGTEGIWTPGLVPRLGHCDYGCNACGQVCPSGAIPPLTLEQKRQAVIGTAIVNRDRCLPWASATPCIVCEEMCPTPEKSIRLEEVEVTNLSGVTVTLQRPSVVRELCIGCGICENHCPLKGDAAIQIFTL